MGAQTVMQQRTLEGATDSADWNVWGLWEAVRIHPVGSISADITFSIVDTDQSGNEYATDILTLTGVNASAEYRLREVTHDNTGTELSGRDPRLISGKLRVSFANGTQGDTWVFAFDVT